MGKNKKDETCDGFNAQDNIRILDVVQRGKTSLPQKDRRVKIS